MLSQPKNDCRIESSCREYGAGIFVHTVRVTRMSDGAFFEHEDVLHEEEALEISDIDTIAPIGMIFDASLSTSQQAVKQYFLGGI